MRQPSPNNSSVVHEMGLCKGRFAKYTMFVYQPPNDFTLVYSFGPRETPRVTRRVLITGTGLRGRSSVIVGLSDPFLAIRFK